MTTYNTDQFVQVNYAVGSGGNFLITCLFLFDSIAHWCRDVQHGKISHAAWLDSSWSQDHRQWVFKEPWMPWNITCYSRRLERGNDLIQEDYDRFVAAHASDYFHECWSNQLRIVDRYNKGKTPAFLDRATWIDLVIDRDGIGIYQLLASRKLWLWDSERKLIISQLDDPKWIASKYQHNPDDIKIRMSFDNRYEISGYRDFDDFFENYLRHQHWISCYMTDHAINTSQLVMPISALADFDRFSDRFTSIENHFNQQINRDNLRHFHALWRSRSGL